jgi:hypothetical protein
MREVGTLHIQQKIYNNVVDAHVPAAILQTTSDEGNMHIEQTVVRTNMERTLVRELGDSIESMYLAKPPARYEPCTRSVRECTTQSRQQNRHSRPASCSYRSLTLRKLRNGP